jgi:copper(I)-binding protein
MSTFAFPTIKTGSASRLPRLVGTIAIALSLLLAGFGVASAHEYRLGDLEIGHPWSRVTPPGAKVAGGYLTIANHGTVPDRLISVTSEIAGKAEVHEMAVKDGVMTMRPVDGGLEIPAGGKVELKPGGYHVMLIDIKRLTEEGERFPATLTFEKAGSVTVEFKVEGMAPGGEAETTHH